MNAAFVLENILGHATHAANLKRVLEKHSDVTSVFVDLSMDMPDYHWLFKIPKYGPLFHLSWALRCGFEAKRQLRPHVRKLDVIYFHTQVTASASLRLMKKRPCVLSLDAAPYSETYYQPWDSEERRIRKRRYYKRLFTACVHMVTWSQWAKDNLQSGYDIAPEKITVIPPGVNTQLFRPADEQTTGERPASAISRAGDDVVRILFVGGEFQRKGGGWLSRWARRTQARNWELHIVTRDKLSSRRTDVPNVFIHNSLQNNSPELIALYQKCDIFAFPTRFDCSPVAAMEALAAGLPLVITDSGATGEIVTDGKTGFLIGLKDRDHFFTRLDELVANHELRHQLSRAAREDALERFDADRNYAQLLDLLRSHARRR